MAVKTTWIDCPSMPDRADIDGRRVQMRGSAVGGCAGKRGRVVYDDSLNQCHYRFYPEGATYADGSAVSVPVYSSEIFMVEVPDDETCCND